MTELTPEETAAFLAGPSRWTLFRNRLKNLSRFWSPRERRLQRELQTLHEGIGATISEPGGRELLKQDRDNLEVLFHEVP